MKPRDRQTTMLDAAAPDGTAGGAALAPASGLSAAAVRRNPSDPARAAAPRKALGGALRIGLAAEGGFAGLRVAAPAAGDAIARTLAASGDTSETIMTDTGVTDTGVTDTGVTDTGVTDTGAASLACAGERARRLRAAGRPRVRGSGATRRDHDAEGGVAVGARGLGG